MPEFLRGRPALDRAKRRAIWAINRCRTAVMGGHLDACEQGCTREFHFHSCNHRSCPQCGRQHTAEWVECELGKRVGAPYFMVTFTLPQELRGLFFTPTAKEIYDVFFTAASSALSNTLANPRWLGAQTAGHTAILHTWNQRLHFHPHLHCIVPGAGLDAYGCSSARCPCRDPSLSNRAKLARAVADRCCSYARSMRRGTMPANASVPAPGRHRCHSYNPSDDARCYLSIEYDFPCRRTGSDGVSSNAWKQAVFCRGCYVRRVAWTANTRRGVINLWVVASS